MLHQRCRTVSIKDVLPKGLISCRMKRIPFTFLNRPRFLSSTSSEWASNASSRTSQPVVDVVLLLEGTYPFVPGGVSTWVHGLVTGMSDISFGLVFLGASFETRKLRYKLPSNVRFLSEISVYDCLKKGASIPKDSRKNQRDKAFATVTKFFFDLLDGHTRSFDQVFESLADRTIPLNDLVYSPHAWHYLREVYDARAREVSFIDFFWAWRHGFIPLLNLFYADLPPARTYHAISTGWAGYLGAIAKKRHGRPLLLTEHGIYLNERCIEINQSKWRDTRKDKYPIPVSAEMNYIQKMWIHLFSAISKLCYEHCNRISTLCELNRSLQIKHGAPEDRIQIIPNGVEIKNGAAGKNIRLPKNKSFKQDIQRIGFVGRIVPIKDIKTLIMSCRRVVDEFPDIEILLMGPTEEDKPYFNECQALVTLLQLEDTLRFLGRVYVHEYYPTLEIQVLTSVSEGQPLSILEGYCYGVPVVSTAVGACAEMIEGLTTNDKALGPSGIITRVADPDGTANAILTLLRNPKRRQKMSDAARRRVRRFYSHPKMITRYRHFYQLHRATHP